MIKDLLGAIPYFDEPELCEIAENVLRKLDKLSDEEFSAIEFVPEYFNEDEDAEAEINGV